MESEDDLGEIIINKLEARDFTGVLSLMKDNKYTGIVQKNPSDAIRPLVNYLTENNFHNDASLYQVAEDLLKITAELGNPEEVILELLEIIESNKSDTIFTTALKALQVSLLRQGDKKARSLEWCLNTVQCYIAAVEFPEKYVKQWDAMILKVLEEDPEVSRILTLYVTLSYFYEPLHKKFITEVRETFKNYQITKTNALISFYLQLLDKPLSYLDLTNPEKSTSTNMYSWQCSSNLVKNISELLRDPFYLLSIGEHRSIHPIKYNKESVYEQASKNIFHIEEKVPLISLALYYYLLFAEKLVPENAPRIYSIHYIFEMNLYFIEALLRTTTVSYALKGLKLLDHQLTMLNDELINTSITDLHINKKFLKELVNQIIYSDAQLVRKKGIVALKRYIHQFDDEGRYIVLMYLWSGEEHSGLWGYMATLYKNMIAEKLMCSENQLPKYFCGDIFHNLLTNKICYLKNGVETDLVCYSDLIISALNMLRFLSIRDSKNQTSFWNYRDEITTTFLNPLRKALDLSRPHFKLEMDNVLKGADEPTPRDSKLKISMRDGSNLPEVDKEHKLSLLANALNTFDLIDSLLARVNECIAQYPC